MQCMKIAEFLCRFAVCNNSNLTTLNPYVCRWNDRELKFARTLIFTVEEINRDNKLLPGVSLGYKLYNGCGSENLLRAALEAINGEDSMGCSAQIQALIGHSSSGVSKDINTILSPLSIPQVRRNNCNQLSLCNVYL